MSGQSDVDMVRQLLYQQLPEMAANLASASANIEAMRREIDGLRADHADLKRQREQDRIDAARARTEDANAMKALSDAINNMRAKWALVLLAGGGVGGIISAIVLIFVTRFLT